MYDKMNEWMNILLRNSRSPYRLLKLQIIEVIRISNKGFEMHITFYVNQK